MRRADRLFDIIQTMRASARPLTAAALADRLEVTARTIYRDIGRPASEPHADRQRTRHRLGSVTRLRPAVIDVHGALHCGNARGTESLLTLCWRELKFELPVPRGISLRFRDKSAVRSKRLKRFGAVLCPIRLVVWSAR